MDLRFVLCGVYGGSFLLFAPLYELRERAEAVLVEARHGGVACHAVGLLDAREPSPVEALHGVGGLIGAAGQYAGDGIHLACSRIVVDLKHAAVDAMGKVVGEGTVEVGLGGVGLAEDDFGHGTLRIEMIAVRVAVRLVIRVFRLHVSQKVFQGFRCLECFLHVADGEVAVDEVVDEIDKVAEVAFGLRQRFRLVDGRLHEGDAFVVQVEVEHALAGDVVELIFF